MKTPKYEAGALVAGTIGAVLALVETLEENNVMPSSAYAAALEKRLNELDPDLAQGASAFVFSHLIAAIRKRRPDKATKRH